MVYVCSVNDAACAEVPHVRQCTNCPERRALTGAQPAPAAPFPKGGWQHAVDDALVNHGKTSEEFASPHEAVAWLLECERAVAIALVPAAQPADSATITLQQRVAELVEQHGSLRAAAKVLECDVGYLSRLASGEKDEPGDLLRRRMGLRRVVTFERIKP